MKKTISIILILTILATLTACGSTATTTKATTAGTTNAATTTTASGKAEVVFTTATPVAEDSVNHFIAFKAKELMESKSNGRIQMDIYEGGQLGPDREMVEGLQTGTIDFFVTISATFVTYAPKTGIFDLPNAFPSLAVARKVLDGDILKEFEPEYEAKGLKMLGFSDAGFRQTTSSKPLKTIEDFKGLKIRTMQNPNHLEYWKNLGANPTPMDFSELYISLQQGAIDAQENPYDLIVANKLYEPQKYIIETNHVLHALTMMMSKASYDKLPDDLKVIVEESVKEALAYGRVKADERIESRKKIILDYGCEISTISDELRNQMLEMTKPAYDKIRETVGTDLVDRFLAEIKANS